VEKNIKIHVPGTGVKKNIKIHVPGAGVKKYIKIHVPVYIVIFVSDILIIILNVLFFFI
jgi:hypothetical protein